MNDAIRKLAIIGGGPSALFMLKALIDGRAHFAIEIFERGSVLGAGMPYSHAGACDEHITNVSPNEIPEMATTVQEWLKNASPRIRSHFNITAESLNEYKVLPRLFFGEYLSGQFSLLLEKAAKNNLEVKVHLDTTIIDIADDPGNNETLVITEEGSRIKFDHVVICTGHNWPRIHEGIVPGYFESPYPPSKLNFKVNHPVAIRGASLTAIDAVRTLARHHGKFIKRENGMLEYKPEQEYPLFKIILHSLGGLLPALRFHLEDSHLQKNAVLNPEVVKKNREENDGFLSMDFVFEKNFKDFFLRLDPTTYEWIKDMKMEEFVDHILSVRESIDPIDLFKAEYAEAEKSIRRKQSVHWKEMLAVLSFAMNYPAKHFSAEDMLRLQKVLKPLISIVIAFVPQSSARELIALYQAGIVEMVAVGPDASVEPGEKEGAVVHFKNEQDEQLSIAYPIFIDAIGQPQLQYNQFPFRSLIDNRTISAASLKFRSAEEGARMAETMPRDVRKSDIGDYYLKVAGIAINDNFQVLDRYGAANPRICIMAVPYIGGYNPDYSGLDFCETASVTIAEKLLGK
jgi:hypothetical protein